MVAYFVRRFLERGVALLGATFVFYSLVVYFPGGVKDDVAFLDTLPLAGAAPWRLVKEYEVREPWPTNYLLWLFNPNDTNYLDPNDNTRVIQKGIDVQLGSLTLRGSGILTGDWGYPSKPPYGQSVIDLMGTTSGCGIWLF